MKRFTVPCDFGESGEHPFHVYIGEPSYLRHPLYYQTKWLYYCRNGNIPKDVINSFAKLYSIARKNRVSFEELAVYALGDALVNQNMEIEGNVISIKDIQLLKKELKYKNDADDDKEVCVVWEDRTLLDSHIFGCFVSGENIREFCATLASRALSTVKGEFHTHQIAEGILEIILFHEAIRRSLPAKQRKNLYESFHPNVIDNGLYNLMILADTTGCLLTAKQLGMIDIFFSSDEADEKRIIKLAYRALTTWASRKATVADTISFAQAGLNAENILSLKKTIKAFTAKRTH